MLLVYTQPTRHDTNWHIDQFSTAMHQYFSWLAGLMILWVLPAPAMFSSFSNISIRKLIFSTLSVNECKYLQRSVSQV